MKAPILQCDVDMAVFLATRSVASVIAEAPYRAIDQILDDEYDQTTEQNLRYLRGQTERKAA